MKKLIILGSTGSIGTQSLDVARKHNFKVDALAASSNIELLEQQIREFKPQTVAVFNEQKGFRTSGKHHRRNHSQHRAFDEMLVDDLRLVYPFDDRFGKIIADPRILIGIFEINLCIVDSFRHIAKVDVEHGISTLPLVN